MKYVETEKKQAIASIRFDWIVAMLSLWFIGGLYNDGWAHNHFGLDSFFTPWHGLFYSGGTAVGIAILSMIYSNHKKGYSWRGAIPRGYETSVAGLAIFAVGGVGDMFWHILFGIEANVEALLSPTHLILALGMGLIVSGPLRSAWLNTAPQRKGWLARFPMLLSLTVLYSVITFFTQFGHPFERPWAAIGNRPVSGLVPVLAPNPTVLTKQGAVMAYSLVQEASIESILLQTVFLMGFVLLAVRRWDWKLPIGSFTALMTLNGLGMGFMRDELALLPVAILGGVATDVLLATLKPSVARSVEFRVFAFAVPAIFYLLYFVELMIVAGGVWWSIHLWLGSVVMAGAVGALIAQLMVLSTRTPTAVQPLADRVETISEAQGQQRIPISVR